MAKVNRNGRRKGAISSNNITCTLVACVLLLGLVSWSVQRCSLGGATPEANAGGESAAESIDEQWKQSTSQAGTAEASGAEADDPTEHTKSGNAKLLEMPATQRGEVVVSHTGFTLSYNSETNCPNWVAWELTRQEAAARGKRSPDFFPDPSVAVRSRVTTDDYRGSGYTRGHMCPSADMRWSTEAQHDCFYMSNMCPQVKELNADSWEWLETSCRRWAEQEGSVYIVCGPVFNDWRKARTIGREHKVRVPDGFFKVVLSLKAGQEKAIGFYYANNDREQTMESASMSVDEIEQLTGYDFFYQIDKKLEQRVESQFNLREWK